MTLLSSFKIVVNGFVKSVNKAAFVPQQTLLREIYSTPYLYRKRSVEEKLGLPIKPKRPLSGYARFVRENIASLSENNPNSLLKGHFALIAKKWNTIGDERKEEYMKLHRAEKLEYREKLMEYKQRPLSDDDQKRVQELKTTILAKKARLNKAKKRAELGMPRKPPNKFLKFFLEQKRGEGKQTIKEHRSFYQEVANKYKGLSDAERAKYQTAAAAESEAYKKAMHDWEADMISKGRIDVIRSSKVFPKLPTKSTKGKEVK